MFAALQRRAEQMAHGAAAKARRRIVAELDGQGVAASESEAGVVLTGHRLSERLRWIGGLFR